MKQIYKYAIAGLVLLSLASCKQEYECECVWYNGEDAKYIYHNIGKMRSTDANFYCREYESDGVRALMLGETTDTIYRCKILKVN
ncbi:MAG TPA: hypothetical protein VKZ76_09560 [Edaphocola sp.]|nr:hypothetical protein [Edaphocola sp.]